MKATLLTYTIGDDGDNTESYANGSLTTALIITDELSGEVRSYSGFTYMGSDDYEEVLFFLHGLWHKLDDYEDMDWHYTVVTEASK